MAYYQLERGLRNLSRSPPQMPREQYCPITCVDADS